MSEDTPQVAAPPASPPASVILHARERASTVPLDWPVTVDGRLIDKVVLRRLTAKQVADFFESVRDVPEDQQTSFPIFFDVDGNRISDAVFDTFDDDDAVKLNKAALDFLPLRFRPGAMGTSKSVPADGETTAPSSGE